MKNGLGTGKGHRGGDMEETQNISGLNAIDEPLKKD